MRLHIEKKAIRALGIAESFRRDDVYSTLAGVVMRSDLVVDGFAIGKLRVSGFDSTKSIVSLFQNLQRNDVNVLLLSGSVLSLYNVVDVDGLQYKLKLPIVAISFKKSSADLAGNIHERFPAKVASRKIALLEKLGRPVKVRLESGFEVYVRTAGMGEIETKRLIDRFTLQGSLPEPIRVARLLARTVAMINKSK